MRNLTDKRVLITGAGHGLGLALAQEFAAAGCEVIATDVDARRADLAAREIIGRGGRARPYPLNVCDALSIANLRERLDSEVGPIDLLVNNAGIVHRGSFLEVSAAEHLAALNVNVGGVVAVTHAFLPQLLQRPEAHLVNIVSAAGFFPLPYAASYAGSKWAALGFSESLREELRLDGAGQLRITVVCPSYIDTGMFAGTRPPRFSRFLTPNEVAQATVAGVRRNAEQVVLPKLVRWGMRLRDWLPAWATRRICDRIGLSTSAIDARRKPATPVIAEAPARVSSGLESTTDFSALSSSHRR